jgi:BirA family transcriptional regulator, biotin operon repressor / biotin---[acetyl-CoA-carboxylase] ligase
VPSSPYTDLDRPPLVAGPLERALVVPGSLWRRIDVRTQTGSTNADVADAARRGEPEGLVVVAERQLAGRGRRDRSWASPPRAGLTLSVLLRPGPGVPPKAWGWLPLLAGVALRDAVRERAAVDAALKWPNDLLVGDAKCAGILAEVIGDAVVVGIGLNVTTRAEELPDTSIPATSLRLAGATDTDRGPLLRAVLRGLDRWYDGWREAAGDAEMCGLLGEYRTACATLGRPVTVRMPDGADLAGTATTVDRDGQLVIRTADGRDRVISAGDVLHVR